METSHSNENDSTLCKYTEMPIDKCICMIHDPDGSHFRATRPGMNIDSESSETDYDE